jgi:hypothetical protein
MEHFCYKCQEPVKTEANQKVDFRSECIKCKRALHSCLNCNFYDSSAYNHCRESQAEPVKDKERQNFCSYFRFKSGKGNSASTGITAKSKLDDLFK